MTDSPERPAAPDLVVRRGHPQPSPDSYSADQLIALLLEDFTHQSPSQSAALRLLADHRLLLEREDVRAVAVTVLGWAPGRAVPDAPAWIAGADWRIDRGYRPEFGKGRGMFARFDYVEALAAVERGELELNWPSVIVLQFAGMLDAGEGAMRKLDERNREHILRAVARAGGSELAALHAIPDPFPDAVPFFGDTILI